MAEVRPLWVKIMSTAGLRGVKSVHIRVLLGYLYYLLCSQTRFCAS